MARDYIDIGSAPAEECCAQVGSENYRQQAREECNRFIDLLRRTLGPEPAGTQLAIKANRHDFGTYYSVVCWYEEDNEEALKYSLRCEGEAPTRWDDAPAPAPTDSQPEQLRRDQIAYVNQLPKCDLCDQTAEYDARTKHGPWAYLCPDHWTSMTSQQLGTGYGQKLMVRQPDVTR